MQVFMLYLAAGVLSLAVLTAAQTCGQQVVQPDLTIGARRRKRGTITPQIVGGGGAVIDSWPWFASLRNPLHFCGGVVISDEWVLTAGHCVLGLGSNFQVVLGDYNLAQTSGNEQSYFPPEDPKINPGYAPVGIHGANNDIALIKLPEKLTFDEHVQPICLPTVSSYEDGDDAWVIGFGQTSASQGSAASLSNTMQQVKVPLQLPATCRNTAYPAAWISDNMTCAGYPKGKKDACSGDSGGPLMIFNDVAGSWEVAGIVSWGIGCAQPNHPGVYARITQLKAWIEDVINA